MRNAFFKTLTELAKQDARIMLLTGDLGFMAIESFRDTVPGQFHNAGVSEENMVGMAAGLAMAGRRVFVYSIIPFTTLRVYEFIRNDLCYHRLPVTVVGVGAGYAYGNQGATHHAIDDLAVMRALPEMTVVSPADSLEVEAATRALVALDGPAYLRLGKAGEPVLHRELPCFRIGRAITLQEGRDVTMIATGSILGSVIKAATVLQESGIGVRVLSMPVVKPIDVDAIRMAAHETKTIVTVEEHSVIGGLGSAVAEVLTDLQFCVPFKRLGIPDRFMEIAGSQQYLLALNGLNHEGIVRSVRTILGR